MFGALLLCFPSAWAIPPNTPVTNTATVTYAVGGSNLTTSNADTFVTDAGAGNSPPFGLSLTSSSIDENLAGAAIGDLLVDDLDLTDTHTFAVSDPRFIVVGSQLQLQAGIALDFETETSVSLNVTVTDAAGADFLTTLVVGVNDVNEAPQAITLDSLSVDADTNAAAVGNLQVSDPDAGDSHTFALSDPRFEVVSGVLVLASGESLALGESVTLTVTATDSGGLSFAEQFEITGAPAGGGSGPNSSVSAQLFAPGVTGALPTNVNPSACELAGAFTPVPPLQTFTGNGISSSGTVPLLTTNIVKAGDALFLQLLDPDANLDDALVDFAIVEISSSTGDVERVRLSETSASAGVFVGGIQTFRGTAVSLNCRVESDIGEALTLRYTDANDPTDLAQSTVLVDPFGRVFDSASGTPIDGAIVRLVDASTGAAAQVFADDGVTSHPADLVSGSSELALPSGAYRFPVVAAGDYRLEVTPPNRFTHPSVIANASIQVLPGAPYALSPGSRGLDFELPVGPVLRVDIPLDLQPIQPTESLLETLVLAPGGTQSLSIDGTSCFDGSAFSPLANPNSLAAGTVPIPSTQSAQPTTQLVRGDVLIVRVVDADQDQDPFARDSIEVDVSIALGSERERLLLQESGASTGEFVGFLQTGLETTGVANDCILQSSPGSEVQVRYVDASDASDTSIAQVLFDPGFSVFSSSDGAPLDGVRITLIDDLTGSPAVGVTFAPDGVTPFPATVVSGGVVSDAAGTSYDFAPGVFDFPVVTPGRYRLQVEPPAGLAFPSAVSDAALNGLANAPFELVSASRGNPFDVVLGSTYEFDVPLDRLGGALFVTKQASKDVAAVGDFLQYVVRIENTSGAVIPDGGRFVDDLPVGFRFVPNSMKDAQGASVDARVGDDGRTLMADLPPLLNGDAAEFSYVTHVTAGAQAGSARNTATVVGVGDVNTAFADVLVRDELFVSKAIVIGQVFDGACGDEDKSGLAGVRLWLEDGNFVVTDDQGKYHFEDVEPGTHVIRLDPASLPSSHELLACENNTRNAGNAASQFVDVQAGTMWRSDFYVAKKADALSEVVARLDAEAQDGKIRYTYRIRGGAVPLERLSATIMLDEQLAYLGGSATINGRKRPDPQGVDMGALTFRLPDTPGEFDMRIEFDAFVKDPGGPIETKGVVMFQADSKPYRSEVNVNAIGLDWPASLVIVAESFDPLSDSAAANRAALERARQFNKNRLVGTPTTPQEDEPQEIGVVSGVHEPSAGANEARSNVTKTVARLSTSEVDRTPYYLPELDKGKAPLFDLKWLEAYASDAGVVWPPERYNPVLPAIDSAVVHPTGTRVVLLVDGKIVDPITFEGTLSDHQRGVAVSTWENVTISQSDSVIEARILDRDGVTLRQHTRDVHFSGSPARAELVAEASHLVADGVHPPMLAVRLFDRAGYPLRAGMTGEFRVLPPFQAYDQARQLENLDNNFNNNRYQVLRDGVAYIRLEPTSQTAEVKLQFDFDEVRNDEVRARLRPGMRDWIMVGLAEGSYAERSLDGNMETLSSVGLNDESLTDGRVAFYGQGAVRGDWLLTVAYDTDKAFERELREQIDPNQFYSLYGDGTTQHNGAQSQQKLYLKLERDRFAGLFGDFNTQFDRSELSQYDRRLNGLDIGYFGDKVEVKAFASDTDQAFIRDQFQGDGTSGVYRLSADRLVRNSEVIRLVTYDRFATERVIEEVTLGRFVDYTIDYDRGRVIFRQPVFSQDENFNPVFIQVEYEVAAQSGDEALVAGTRVAYRLDDKESTVALTYVNDGAEDQGGELLGVNLDWQFHDSYRVQLEVASSDSEQQGQGDAYLLELEHRSERLAGRAYVREQEQAFGLGHQALLEAGTRKLGVEGEYRLQSDLLVRATAFQQTLLAQNTDRFIVNATAQWRLGQQNPWRLQSGIQSVSETSPSGESLDAMQLLLGGSRSFLRNKLTVRGDAELDVSSGDNTDFPSRAILGVEYEIRPEIALIGEQEFSWSETRRTQDSRFGIRARPWRGGEVSSILSAQDGENGGRLFATTGVLQQWRLNERWLVDAGFDRVQTLRERGSLQPTLFNPNVPPTSGSFNEDFTALYTGVGYRYDAWDVSSRVEWHQGDQADKWNFLVGANRQLAEGRVVSASLSAYAEETENGVQQDNTDLRIGLAWRPDGSRWSFLNRTDLLFETRDNDTFDTRTRKWVNNSNLNFKPSHVHQLSLQFGMKYVVDTIDDEQFDGLTVLMGGEYRYDVSPRWDLGVHGSVLASLESDTMQYSSGLSIGHNLFDDAWVSVGYNFVGFDDDDFVAAEYTSRGPFLKVRLKFDESVSKSFLEFVGLGESRRLQPYANSR